ncbi:MAG: hypothetical protein GX131_00300 [candidate division WS1 bacterium]|jgi:hypothetical protein|nr:hypothetical protein [candidate division WS1 bacterium]
MTNRAQYRQRILQLMADVVPQKLETFDEVTGRFITEPNGPIAPGARPEDLGWAVTNQDAIHALAVLFIEGPEPWQRNPELLDVIGRAGDAIRDFQDDAGQVEFVKADGSKWGMTYMPWTNYAWLEAWAMLRAHLDPARAARWEEGLTLAHDGQARELASGHVHNIPCWKAMSCWRAGQLMNRDDWQQAGAEMLARCVETQHPDGYWPEHLGPTNGYNRVYLHAVGLYHIFSGDDSVLPAIEAATRYAQAFTYPDGSMVETIDGRQKYHSWINPSGLVSMTLVPQGRRYVRYLLDLPRFAEALSNPRVSTPWSNSLASHIASLYQYMHFGDEAPIHLDEAAFTEVYSDLAVVKREAPWFGCLSAFVCPTGASRWGLDRQQFVSLWHEDAGLLIGGGNSRNQPEWATFVSNGRFVPDSGEVAGEAISLRYGGTTCSLDLRFEGGAAVIEVGAEGGSAINHLALPLHRGEIIRTELGDVVETGDRALLYMPREMGEWVQIRGFRIELPPCAQLAWPTVPFNPYAIDGSAGFGSEAALLSAPVEGQPVVWRISRP